MATHNRVPKFKKGDTAYFFNQSTVPGNIDGISLLMVSAWVINVTEVKKSKVIGFTMKQWLSVKHMHPSILKKTCIDNLTNEKIVSMNDYDYVRMLFINQDHDLMTKDELKLAMITWIANDFNDPTDESHMHE